jgi:hypothetical protein
MIATDLCDELAAGLRAQGIDCQVVKIDLKAATAYVRPATYLDWVLARIELREKKLTAYDVTS